MPRKLHPVLEGVEPGHHRLVQREDGPAVGVGFRGFRGFRGLGLRV